MINYVIVSTKLLI